MNNADDVIRHDAALAHANGDTRGAISILMNRINATNGHCDVKLWLCILDIYHIQRQQAAYEKLAVFFSNRFHFSAPAWDPHPGEETKQTGLWRNALVIEGSPLDIHDDKIRDFVRASKEAQESRIDLSRMRLDSMEVVMDQEIKKLLNIMQRLRRIRCPTLLMGDAETVSFLQNIAKNSPVTELKDGDSLPDIIDMPGGMAWMMLFEILQWRGKEKEFNALALEFAERYHYCPIGYDPSMAIALSPTSPQNPKNTHGGFEAEATVLDATPFMLHAEEKWQQNLAADFDLSKTTRFSFEAGQQLASFLQANSHADGVSPEDTVISEVSEIIGALLDATGVSAYCDVHYKNVKLRDLLEV